MSSLLASFCAAPRARWQLRGCASVGRDPRVLGSLWIRGTGRIIVGDRVFFDAAVAPIEILAWPSATITFGDDSYIGGGTSIEATCSIVFGPRARVGAFCKLMDNHFHPLVGDRHLPTLGKPVLIDSDSVLAPRTIVLAGAHLREGERTLAGSLLHRARPVPS